MTNLETWVKGIYSTEWRLQQESESLSLIAEILSRRLLVVEICLFYLVWFLLMIWKHTGDDNNEHLILFFLFRFVFFAWEFVYDACLWNYAFNEQYCFVFYTFCFVFLGLHFFNVLLIFNYCVCLLAWLVRSESEMGNGEMGGKSYNTFTFRLFFFYSDFILTVSSSLLARRFLHDGVNWKDYLPIKYPHTNKQAGCEVSEREGYNTKEGARFGSCLHQTTTT